MCIRRLFALLLFVVAVGHSADPKPKTDKVEPLKTAWEKFVRGPDQLAEFEKLTSVQRYDSQMKSVAAAQRSAKNKTYSLRLKVTGVIEPTQHDKLMLVHAQYVEDEYCKIFGAGGTIGIWTSDYKTALQLRVGEEFDLRGNIFYEVHHFDNDVAKVPSLWQRKNINTSVAHFHNGNTRWVRDARIYMINPAIVRLSENERSGQ